MTKKDFNKQFIEEIARNLDKYAASGSLDKPAVCLDYNTQTDSMCKSGEITSKQYNNWCTPKGALNLSYLKRVKSKL